MSHTFASLSVNMHVHQTGSKRPRFSSFVVEPADAAKESHSTRATSSEASHSINSKAEISESGTVSASARESPLPVSSHEVERARTRLHSSRK